MRWDAAVVAGVLGLDVLTALTTADDAGRPLLPVGLGLMIVASGVLLWRHRFPVAVLVVTGVVTLVYYPLGFPDAPVVLSLAIALYTVARHRGWVLAAGAVAVLSAILVATAEEAFPAVLGIVPILLLPVVLGEVARFREKQAERQAAVEERLRIARELHDVLAHQISLISVQSGAALHTRDPDGAFDALRAIRSASGEALKEIRSVLGVLREDGPDLSGLADLFRRAEAAGLVVRTQVDGEKPPLEVQLAAYRIIQEALTNVVRHASAASVDVTIRQTDTAVEITVDDDGSFSETEIIAGNGIRGMIERASALGGDCQAGPRPGGGFRVRARLPATPTPTDTLTGNGTR
ncbi:signal transduction histidine kinase [Actinoplanes lutulentus]|uniref:histidine kinase n=1 Tax=Actinoplanes lutulentus TaxID=1287878 RepID=A0A327Z969_9ACTN|nr:sensor histidine kinase [Actinoplanes lutulentus]MBB2947732.1 signal transduction histidine kinase [Actinoplanes lutulentus]RAK27787.1 signal transduction histidine kinase [Actinoplanes lutulentus]